MKTEITLVFVRNAAQQSSNLLKCGPVRMSLLSLLILPLGVLLIPTIPGRLKMMCSIFPLQVWKSMIEIIDMMQGAEKDAKIIVTGEQEARLIRALLVRDVPVVVT